MSDEPTSLADVVELAKNDPHKLERLRAEGRLVHLLTPGAPPRHDPPTEGQWSRHDLDTLTRERRHAEISDALDRGQLANILEGNTA